MAPRRNEVLTHTYTWLWHSEKGRAHFPPCRTRGVATFWKTLWVILASTSDQMAPTAYNAEKEPTFYHSMTTDHTRINKVLSMSMFWLLAVAKQAKHRINDYNCNFLTKKTETDKTMYSGKVLYPAYGYSVTVTPLAPPLHRTQPSRVALSITILPHNDGLLIYVLWKD